MENLAPITTLGHWKVSSSSSNGKVKQRQKQIQYARKSSIKQMRWEQKNTIRPVPSAHIQIGKMRQQTVLFSFQYDICVSVFAFDIVQRYCNFGSQHMWYDTVSHGMICVMVWHDMQLQLHKVITQDMIYILQHRLILDLFSLCQCDKSAMCLCESFVYAVHKMWVYVSNALWATIGHVAISQISVNCKIDSDMYDVIRF